MKRIIIKIFISLIFICGAGAILYPTVSNTWNNYVQNRRIDTYEESVSNMTENDYINEWKLAEDFNSNIIENKIGADVFDIGAESDHLEESQYYSVLNINGDGVMGYLSIPKINLKLPIVHGTLDDDIQTALGHMNGTALPIGGESTHSVIAGHRGLPSARLFTDLDQIQVGDKFYIHILNEVLAYEVDQILPMIEADDIVTLSNAMKVEKGKDYVTLFTCTPYGLNTHRLLVRGIRTEYLADDEVPKGISAVVESTKDYYIFYTLGGLLFVGLVVIIMKVVFKKRIKDK